MRASRNKSRVPLGLARYMKRFAVSFHSNAYRQLDILTCTVSVINFLPSRTFLNAISDEINFVHNDCISRNGV